MAIASAGMKNDEIRMAVISQNLANVSTPGYKKQVAVAAPFAAQVAAAEAAGANAAAAAPGNRIALDATNGVLRHTGVPTDVAIEGDGFFELEGEGGPVYTRQGSLHLDLQGRLVGVQNLPVTGNGGPVVLSNTPFGIAANGEIRQGDRVVATLKVVKFEHPELMIARGNGTYAQGGARLADNGGAIRIRTGFQEGSNVNSAEEMVRLTETVRHFEAMQKAVQGYDESLGNTIRKLGEF